MRPIERMTCLILAAFAIPALALDLSRYALKPGPAAQWDIVPVTTSGSKSIAFISPESASVAPTTRRGSAHSCEATAGSLCYDDRSGHAVYRPIRNLMPAIGGLTPENVVLRRDRITFSYSFP